MNGPWRIVRGDAERIAMPGVWLEVSQDGDCFLWMVLQAQPRDWERCLAMGRADTYSAAIVAAERWFAAWSKRMRRRNSLHFRRSK